jgi:hypothetical protein
MEPLLPKPDGACFTSTFDVSLMGTASPWDLVQTGFVMVKFTAKNSVKIYFGKSEASWT